MNEIYMGKKYKVKPMNKGNWAKCINTYQDQFVDSSMGVLSGTVDDGDTNNFTYPLYPLVQQDGNVAAMGDNYPSYFSGGTDKCKMYNDASAAAGECGKQVYVWKNGIPGKNQNQCDYAPFIGTYKCGNTQYTMTNDSIPFDNSVDNQSMYLTNDGVERSQPTTGTFSCATQYNFCNTGMLILNDDGSVNIKNGDQAKDWLAGIDSGSTWKSDYPLPPYIDTNGKKIAGTSDWSDQSVMGYADPNYSMNSSDLDGKSWQGRNYLYPNEMLNKGEWLGSTNGCFYLKFENKKSSGGPSYSDIMKKDETGAGAIGDAAVALGPGALAAEQAAMAITGAFQLLGESTHAHMGFIVYFNKLKCTDGKGNDKSEAALYQLMQRTYTWMTPKLNKVGFVGDDTKIHEYPDNLVTQGQDFYYMGQYSNTGNNISKHTGHTFDASSCGALCLEDDNCAGFVINDKKHCYLKNNKMFPMSNRTPSQDNTQLYIRSKDVKNSLSCPNEVEQTSALQWELYPIGDKMNINTLCELGLASKEDRAVLKKANDELTNMKGNLSSNYNKLQTEGTKLTKSLSNNIDKLDKDIHSYEKVQKQTAKMKEKTTNINAMNSESELDMISKNTSYMIWSILAIIVVVGGIKATRH